MNDADHDNNDINIGELVAAAQQQNQHVDPVVEDEPIMDDNNNNEEDDHEDDDNNNNDNDDDVLDRDADGVLDGGVAGVGPAAGVDDSSTAAARRRSSECDLILYITCAETMDDLAPNHPVLKEGVVVSIGLDKNTKLGAVFKRYTDFCNETAKLSSSNTRMEEGDLEFFHTQLLCATDTAEASALMKNDRISVRRERQAERETQIELKRLQRESDREYFKHCRQLLPDFGSNKYFDLILDCQGTISDESGRNQQVLSTTVKGHSVILSKRCKWLGSLIQTARDERVIKQRAMLQTTAADADEVLNEGTDDEGNFVMDNANNNDDDDNAHGGEVVDMPEGRNIVASMSSNLREDDEDETRPSLPRSMNMEDDDFDEDDDIGVLSYPVRQNQQQRQGDVPRSGATEIENDDDNDEDGNDSDGDSIAAKEPRKSRARNFDSTVKTLRLNAQQELSDYLWVTLPNHPPDAVKLLLEYCYTNRVISLGYEAFIQSCKTRPLKPNGSVAPYSSARRWPQGGAPQVSLSVALAGIALAEEAGMPRLSLMCEVAASQLVSMTGSNITEALSACTQQAKLTGNPLTRLREVAIGVILRVGPRGVYDTATFRRALEERSTSIIPTLLNGLMEAVEKEKKQHEVESSRMSMRAKILAGRKRNLSAITESYLTELDREDLWKREHERRKRRKEREGGSGNIINHDDEEGHVYCDQVLSSSSWAAESARRSLKRMAPHVNVNNFHVDRTGAIGIAGAIGVAPREAFGTRVGYGPRKRSSRRRTSGRN